MPKKITMDDIAQLAGVSKSTVSRALQNSNQVSEETKTKIRQIAYEYNYRLTSSAWEWRKDSLPNITLVLPTGRTSSDAFSTPFAMELVSAIADELVDREYNSLLTKYPLSRDDAVQGILSAGPSEGIILIGQRRDNHKVKQIARDIPNLVVWGAVLPDLNYCAIGTDNRRGGQMATEHLIKLGRTQIAFLGDTKFIEPKLRYLGYRDAHKSLGLPVRAFLYFETPYDRLSAYHQLKKHLQAGLSFDAIFAASDILAMSAIQCLSDCGYSVPDDVAVVGYDDISLAQLLSPPLTTIRQPIQKGSRQMVDSLLKLNSGEPAQSTILDCELVIRGSCGA